MNFARANQSDSLFHSSWKILSGKWIILILIVAFFSRLLFIGLYGDLQEDYYWEYGEIAKNLIEGNGYAFYSLDGEGRVLDRYSPGAEAIRSAYMPPGYVFFLVPYLMIDHPPLRNVLLLLTHLLLSTATIWLLYRVTAKNFSEKTGLVAAAIGAILPEFLYANLSFTPTVLYHFLVLLLFLLIPEIRRGGWRIPIIGLLLAVLMYLRAEFVLFVLLFLSVLIFRKEVTRALLIGGVAFAAILPWTIRNYIAFDTFVPMTTGFGLNFYRGHNPDHIGSFGEREVAPALQGIEEKRFEIVMNKEYQRLALDYMREHPGEEIENVFAKLFWFFSYIPFYPDSGNLLYLLPTILLFFLSIYGVILTFSWEKFWAFYLFFAALLITIMIFFPIPRYQTMMKILQLPFAAHGLLTIWQNWQNKKRPGLTNNPGQ